MLHFTRLSISFISLSLLPCTIYIVYFLNKSGNTVVKAITNILFSFQINISNVVWHYKRTIKKCIWKHGKMCMLNRRWKNITSEKYKKLLFHSDANFNKFYQSLSTWKLRNSLGKMWKSPEARSGLWATE